VADKVERFAPEPENIGAARSLVRGSLGPADDKELAELLTDELSSNAVDHAGTAFTVAVSHDDEGALTVEVHDHDPQPPVMAPLDPDASRGRGLLIVDALSQEWGVTMIHDDGKTVWFRLTPNVQGS
jgi:anti-sigma regulatory factor (Ser/Thr protein kinase)